MNNKVKFLRGTSDEYAVAEKDSDTIYFTTDDGKLYIGDKEISGSDITIDDTLSDTSTNPVQNKVVKQAIDNKADKTVATTSADGLMSAEDKTKLDSVGDTYALKSKYGDTTIDVGRKTDTTAGARSTAEGYDTTASGNFSHAEGIKTTASGAASHAEGYYATASGAHSHAEGLYATASGAASHAGGTGTKALHDNEVAYGKYNESKDDTVFSVGDGTADNARHNAFEITATGGKLHDKDIATTDLIPTELPANGGNADTLNNLYADDFVNATDRNHITIPNNADVPAWIIANGKRYRIYMTNTANIGMTNIPNGSNDWVWYWFDGINIIAREWATGKYYICDMINGNFSGWKDIYTSGYKPYVTGTVSAKYGEKANISFGFTPSMVLYQPANPSSNVPGSIYQAIMDVDANGFTPNQSTYKQEDSCGFVYIAFK